MDKTKLEELLAAMARSGAETLHLISGHAPCLRLQGNLVRSPDAPLAAAQLSELAREFLFADHRARLAAGHDVEVVYCSRGGMRFRTTVMEQSGGLSFVMRRLPHEIPKLADLGLPDLVTSFATFRSGLVLIAGFLGSGKSTTLASFVERINQDRAAHVITIENPIEFLHAPAQAIVHQREVGTHVAHFADGVREAVRQGADVLAVGEIADYATFDAALEAAESGLLVLATIEGSSIQSALTELLARTSQEQRARTRQRLASVLRAMMSQTLLQKSHGSGRVPLVEILLSSPQVADALRDDRLADLPTIMQKCRGLGMQTIDLALKTLLARNLIGMDEALYHAVDRDWVAARGTARAPTA